MTSPFPQDSPQRGAGITRSDLLVINKIDLAPFVGASLEMMDRDARKMHGTRPFVFTNIRGGEGSVVRGPSTRPMKRPRSTSSTSTTILAPSLRTQASSDVTKIVLRWRRMPVPQSASWRASQVPIDGRLAIAVDRQSGSSEQRAQAAIDTDGGVRPHANIRRRFQSSACAGGVECHQSAPRSRPGRTSPPGRSPARRVEPHRCGGPWSGRAYIRSGRAGCRRGCRAIRRRRPCQ